MKSVDQSGLHSSAASLRAEITSDGIKGVIESFEVVGETTERLFLLGFNGLICIL